MDELCIESNPVTRSKLYRPFVIHYAPGVCVLDGVEVSTEERSAATSLFGRVSDSKLLVASLSPTGPARSVDAGSVAIELVKDAISWK